MKKHFVKIAILVLLVAMLAPLMLMGPAAEASATTNRQKLDSIQKKLEDMEPTGFWKKSIKELKSAKHIDGQIANILSVGIAAIQSEDQDELKNALIDGAATAINLLASCFGCGAVSGVLTGVLGGLLKTPVPSEIDLLKTHLDEQFEAVNENIFEVRKDIANLSNEMTETVAAATAEIAGVVRATADGQAVYAFLSGGEGNFSYRQLKNYLFGVADEKNALAATAYVDKLSKLNKDYETGKLREGEYEELLDEYYNALYRSLTTGVGERTPYIELLHEYVFPEYGESVQKKYYNWLLASGEVENAESEAIRFAQDIYMTVGAAA